ncbi:MAG: class II aldolase/adducin family protein [Acidiferrobacterales bacterium]
MTHKQDLVETYRLLRQHGLNDSHSGNASIRDNDTVWITPTGACADTLKQGDLVACGIDGTSGEHASLDTPLHIAVYQSNPEARCVLHSHGPYTVAITMDGNDYVPPDFEGAYYFRHVPVLTIPYQDYLDESPGQVSRSLMKHRIVVVRGHGAYTCAETINLAYKWTSSLESSAKTTFIAKLSGTLPNRNSF